MIEPVALEDFFITFFASAMVIMLGAGYALLFTFARLWQRKYLAFLAYLAYSLLAINVLVLARTLHLHGFWQALVWVMLLGYLFAPHGIWYLCVGTHIDSQVDTPVATPVFTKNQTHSH